MLVQVSPVGLSEGKTPSAMTTEELIIALTNLNRNTQRTARINPMTPCEKGTSAIVRCSLSALTQLSGAVPSAILQPEIYGISSGAGAGLGLVAGVAAGYFKAKANPQVRYIDEWGEWLVSWAAKKVCAKALYASLSLAASTGNTLFAFWEPQTAAIVNGVLSGIATGYHTGRFSFDGYSKKCSKQDSPLINA